MDHLFSYRRYNRGFNRKQKRKEKGEVKTLSIEKDADKVGKYISKHAKLIIVGLIAYLLIVTPIGLNLLSDVGVVNPGFPGAYCATYGVNFEGFQGWTGTNEVHVAGNGVHTILSHSTAINGNDVVYWGDCSSTSLTIVHDFNAPPLSGISSTEQELETDVQSPIPLASYNYQTATPLNISQNIATWDQGEELSFWNPTGIQSNTTTTLANGTRINSVTYTGEVENLLLIPGNFWIDISIPSSRSNAGTGSGWQEGSWTNLDLWFELYWYNWLSVYSMTLKQNAGSPPSSVMDQNARAEQFNSVGGFPIQGWIQQYESLMNGQDISSIEQCKGSSSINVSATGVSLSTLQNIEGSISLAPQYNGQSIPLYTKASDSYVLPTAYMLNGEPSGSLDLQAQGLLQSPDYQTVLPAEFFKIHINSIGTYTDGDVWSGWTVYYPAVSYLVRFIFAVYGSQPFVWTVNTALSLGYNATANYQVPPAQWTNKEIVTVTQAGIGTGLDAWLSNPWNLAQLWMIIAMVIVLIIVVTNPGVINKILGRKGKEE